MSNFTYTYDNRSSSFYLRRFTNRRFSTTNVAALLLITSLTVLISPVAAIYNSSAFVPLSSLGKSDGVVLGGRDLSACNVISQDCVSTADCSRVCCSAINNHSCRSDFYCVSFNGEPGCCPIGTTCGPGPTDGSDSPTITPDPMASPEEGVIIVPGWYEVDLPVEACTDSKDTIEVTTHLRLDFLGELCGSDWEGVQIVADGNFSVRLPHSVCNSGLTNGKAPGESVAVTGLFLALVPRQVCVEAKQQKVEMGHGLQRRDDHQATITRGNNGTGTMTTSTVAPATTSGKNIVDIVEDGVGAGVSQIFDLIKGGAEAKKEVDLGWTVGVVIGVLGVLGL